MLVWMIRLDTGPDQLSSPPGFARDRATYLKMVDIHYGRRTIFTFQPYSNLLFFKNE